MGSKGSNTTTQNQTSTYTANPAVSGAGNMAISMAQNAASQPFNLPTAPVAGFTPDQLQAFQQYRNAQGMAQPYYNQAQGLFQQSAAPITSAQTNNYLNPYASYVLGNLKETQGQQMNDLTGRLTQAAGGVGADRIAVGQGELARQQNLATGQTLAGIYGNALSAAQQDAQRQQSAAYGIGNLGGAAQNASLQGTQALLGGGNQQQAQQQNVLNAPYYNQLAQIAYPYQNAQFLAGITGGLAGAMGGTTTGQKTTTGPSPSLFSQLLGAGTAAVGGIGASGGFGANGWATPYLPWGQSDAYGGGNAYNSAYGGSSANPLSGLSPSDYGPGYAEGGEVINPTQGDASWLSVNPTIPKMDLKPAQVNQPQLQPWTEDKGGGGGNSGINWGDIASTALKLAPMLLAQGGSVYPGMGPNYADGGDATYDDGQGPFRLDPAAYGKWQDENPVPGPNDISTADNATLPPNASPTAGSRPTRPYEFLSPGAADTAEANARGMDGRSFQLPYDVDHRQDVSRNFARDPWMALVAAGAGMMSGDSPFAGINIGKGLTAGVNYLGEQRKASREEETVNQRARQLALEAEKHRDSMTKMTPYQAAQVEDQKKRRELEETRLDVQGWQKGETNILTGDTPYFKPATKESGVLKSDGTWVQRNAAQDEGAGATPPAPPTATPPQPPAPAPGITPPAATNQPVPPPAAAPPLGVKDLASDLEPPDILGNIGYVGKNSPITASNKKETDLALARFDKNISQLPTLKRDIADMRLAYQTLTKDADKDGFLSQIALQPGASFGDRLEYAKKVNQAKIAAGLPPVFNPDKVAAAENINKIQNRMGLTFASQISPREAFAGQKIGIESSPGLTNTPLGMRRLLAGFEAAVQNAEDEYNFFQNYARKNRGIVAGWRQEFEKRNPAERYSVRALLSDLPPEVSRHLAEDVEALRKNPTEKNKKIFNEHYRDTANYFLTGKVQ